MIRRTELDAIPVLAVPDAGPPAAGITFRVGFADEQLGRSEVTHLVEHLALHRLGIANHHVNGNTAPFFTSFYTQGPAASSVRFLQEICQALTELPMERLQLEKDVLRTESEGRPSSPADRLWLWRHGSRGAGLAGYREIGLPELTPDYLRGWVARYFTRENAVVWFSGMEVPEGLTLPLPPGRREPLAASPQVVSQLPAHFPDRGGRIGYEVRVPRSAAAVRYGMVLERELLRTLRQEQGLSYAVNTHYLPIGADTAALFAVADAADGSESAALGEFLDVLARLRWAGPDPRDVADLAERIAADVANPLADVGRLPAEAGDLLLGVRLQQLDEVQRVAAEVTAADVQQVAENAAATALLMTPGSLDAEWAGFAASPGWSEAAVPGQPVIAHNAPENRLVIGADGVSQFDGEHVGTVRFDDCTAMLAWPDGGRLLIGGDGVSCPVEPTLYPLDPGVIGYLDQRVPASVLVRMPPRRPEAIPSPPEPAPAERRLWPGRRSRRS